jgi:hypothetical protein
MLSASTYFGLGGTYIPNVPSHPLGIFGLLQTPRAFGFSYRLQGVHHRELDASKSFSSTAYLTSACSFRFGVWDDSPTGDGIGQPLDLGLGELHQLLPVVGPKFPQVHLGLEAVDLD